MSNAHLKSDLRWGTIQEARDLGIEDMLALHWEEIELNQETVPLAINWSAYRDLERRGILKTLLMLIGGRLIGYSVFFVQPTLHHMSTRWAVNDILYLEPERRKGLAGARLVRGAEPMLAELGVEMVIYTVKMTGNLRSNRRDGSVGELLKKLGYSPYEATFTKPLN